MIKNLFTNILIQVVIAILFLPVNFSYIIWKNITKIALDSDESPQITIFFDNSLDEYNLCNIITQLQIFENIIYMNRLYHEQNVKKQPNCFKLSGIFNKNKKKISISTFNFSSKIDFKNLSDVLNDKIIKVKGVKKVIINESLSSHLYLIKGLVTKAMIIISFLMFLPLFLIISYNIKFKISSSYDIIKIMKLIGATDWFIIQSFLKKNITNCLIGVLISLITTYVTISKLSNIFIKFTGLFNTKFYIKNFLLEEFLFIIILSLIIGWIAAMLETNKCLNKFKI